MPSKTLELVTNTSDGNEWSSKSRRTVSRIEWVSRGFVIASPYPGTGTNCTTADLAKQGMYGVYKPAEEDAPVVVQDGKATKPNRIEWVRDEVHKTLDRDATLAAGFILGPAVEHPGDTLYAGIYKVI